MFLFHLTVFIVFLRRAGFAADAVSFYIAVFAAALAHHGHQHFPHAPAGIRRDGVGLHGLFLLFDDVAVRIFHGFHDVRLQQFAAVDHGAKRIQRLNGRGGNGLPKADARQVSLFYVFFFDDNAACLGRHIHPDFLPEAEFIQIGIHRVRPQP